MVYIYETKDKDAIIFVPKNAYESEQLREQAAQHDVWFHVRGMDSAHIYLRMNIPISDLSEIPDSCFFQCAQLAVNNCRKGKRSKVLPLLYTWASNIQQEVSAQSGKFSFKHKD